MNRKEFIKGSCGICVAIGSGYLLSAMLSSCKTPLGVIKATPSNDILTIPSSEFAEVPFKIIRVKSYPYDLAMQKNPDGSFTTLVLMCTHSGHPLTRTGENYYCTAHGSQFNHEGTVIKAPAAKPLLHLDTHTDNNNILVRLVDLG